MDKRNKKLISLKSVCFDFKEKSSGNGYVFKDNIDVNYPADNNNVSMRLAKKDDYNSLFEICKIEKGWNDLISDLGE